MEKKNIKFVVIGAIVIIAVVFGGLWLTQNWGKTDREVNHEEGVATISDMAKKIGASEAKLVKSAVEYSEDDTSAMELPEITSMPLAVEATTKDYVEIFAVSNIAGKDKNGWMTELAKEFNATNPKVDETPVSVQVRTVASGYAYDYISSGKAVPEAFCPSNDLWVSMLGTNGVTVQVVDSSMVKDVAGILLDEEHYNSIVDKYGTVDMKSITEAVSSGELTFGYTNPFTSATGMNWLISTLLRYDPQNPLSDTAAEGFKSFQSNIPLVALTTQQMVKASSNGSLDGFVNEYQVYQNDPSLQAQYKFVPFGFRHDYPLVAVGEIDNTEMQVLKMFADYCKTNGTEEAKADGFGGMDNYVCEYTVPDGKTLIAAEKFYKKNKDSGTPVVCVFVADVSGSMAGEPLTSLQDSLVNSMKYINSDNYIGLVSYSDDVTINLPINKFDMEQQTYFKGAVESLSANGGTATFDGIIVAADMIQKKMEEIPNAKPMIFVLSDGNSNRGLTLNDIEKPIQAIDIPIYTIGYNANIDALQKISDINEAASINADTDDVTYQLKTLFNANM